MRGSDRLSFREVQLHSMRPEEYWKLWKEWYVTMIPDSWCLLRNQRWTAMLLSVKTNKCTTELVTLESGKHQTELESKQMHHTACPTSDLIASDWARKQTNVPRNMSYWREPEILPKQDWDNWSICMMRCVLRREVRQTIRAREQAYQAACRTEERKKFSSSRDLNVGPGFVCDVCFERQTRFRV